MSCDDSIVLIHAHLSDDERIKVCLEFVRQIKSFGYEVIVTSHTPASKEFRKYGKDCSGENSKNLSLFTLPDIKS